MRFWLIVLLRGFIWATLTMVVAFALSIEWNWRIVVLCVATNIIEAMLPRWNSI